jgi:enoyl-CoA hydratase
MHTYDQEGDIAVLHFDDGKANAVGHAFVDAMEEGLAKAESDAKAVIITGRPDRFSAGFDLSEFTKGADATRKLVGRGARMLHSIYAHPQPVIAACTGHAMAAGAFILLASDTRVGVIGEYKIGLNETAIGMGLPVFGLELARARLSKRHLTRSFIQAQIYDPAGAVTSGFLDEAVRRGDLMTTAMAHANLLAGYPGDAYAANKLALRRDSLATIEASFADFD